MRPLSLHPSALNDAEYTLFTENLASLLRLGAGAHRDEPEAQTLIFGVVRAWMCVRYPAVPARTIDQILALFPSKDTINAGEFFAALRLVLHVEAGKDVDRDLAFVQGSVASVTAERQRTKIPRTRLVEFLYNVGPNQKVFLVKGTPGSGKTTLCGQLHDYILTKDTSARVTVISSWKQCERVSASLEASRIWGPEIDIYGNRATHWVLFDDAEATYEDIYLWASFFKDGPRNYICILLAVYCVHHRGLADIGVSLNNIQAHQQMTLHPTEHDRHSPHIPGLYFLTDEYEDLAEYHQKYEELPTLDVDLKDWIFEASAGHIGAIISIFNAIKSAARGPPRLREMSMATFLGSYPSPEAALHACSEGDAFARGVPTDMDLQHDDNILSVDFLRDLNANGPLVLQSLDPLGAQNAHHQGWITMDDEQPAYAFKTRLNFPSFLHRSRISYLLSRRNSLNPAVEDTTLLDFVYEVISSFSASALAQTARHMSDPKSLPSIPEAQWRRECYKAVYKVTGVHGLWLSPDFGTSKTRGASGRIDFFVMGSKIWGISLLREGNDMSRFEHGGAYYTWMQGGTIQDYVVLDFRMHTQPEKSLPPHPKLYHITFHDQFQQYTVLDSTLSVVKSGVLLA
ncbi:hypothetical protein B0H12DRAFT_1104331 [Mycena haematopus]|nr:hypothetical protein B0H12DRAFT_1104331 [Mycena haematopus]